MNLSARLAFKLSSTAFVAAMLPTLANAQTSDLSFTKQLSNSVRGNLFMRLGYIRAFVKTESSDVRDLNGPVVSVDDLYDASTTRGFSGAAIIADNLVAKGQAGLGIPAGVQSEAKDAGSATLSLGYWLNDEHSVLVEAYVMGLLKLSAEGKGINGSGEPNGLVGKTVVTTKLLPPLGIVGYHFGAKDAFVRPYLGAGAMYAVFFDTKATDALNSYAGGKTSVSIKNAFGVGPFAGAQLKLSDDWYVALTVGQIKLKTHAKLTTYDTQITNDSAVLKDYASEVSTGIQTELDRFPVGSAIPEGYITGLMSLVKRNRGTTDLGTYERRQDLKFTNTIVSLSVGRTF